MEEKRSKNIVIIALCLTLIFMGVGFAALSSTLTINGEASITGTWDVRITNIEATAGGNTLDSTTLDEAGLAAYVANPNTASVNADGLTANFKIALEKPGDYIDYTVTVTNGGSFDATLGTVTEAWFKGSATGTATDNATTDGGDNNVATETGSPIHFSVTKPADTSLASGATDTFVVRAEYLGTWSGVNSPKIGDGKTLADYTRYLTVTMPYTQA